MSFQEDVKDIKICIVGAGMAGLTCALSLARGGFNNIDVYEHASDLGFVGAGIQLAPNMARILDRLGVWRDIEKDATHIRETSIREGSTDKELGQVNLEHVKSLYGFDHMVGHRASLAGSIYDGCKREKSIRFHFASVVSHLRSFDSRPLVTVTPRDGRPAYELRSDVLLACDGVKSNARVSMLEEVGVEAEVEDSGQAAYRIMLSREQMEKDPELLELINTDRVTRWVGERRHVIAYPVANKQIYNISTAQPDVNFAEAPSATYTTKGSKSAMLSVYQDFCPKVQSMLSLVPEGEVCEWKLRVHAPLPTWVLGRVALVGDACHPTLPHLNQGAAQAIEDAAVIGVVLSSLNDSSTDSIHKALRVYEAVRKQRAETLVDLAAQNGKTMQLGEGKAREERDKLFAANKAGKGPSPEKWADADMQKMIYGFDCMKKAEELFRAEFSKNLSGT